MEKNMAEEKFLIENYGKKSTFASFLPGISGEKGIPIWCYYVNRGQCVVSFGVDNKDHSIMEFYPAHQACQNVKTTGFRTFVKKDDRVTELFAEKLWDEFRYPAMAPFSGTVFDLKENEFIEKTVGIPIQKESAANAGTLRTRSSGNAVFDRLVAAGQRLLTVITRNKGGANKDLSKFADQINSLCDKWDR